MIAVISDFKIEPDPSVDSSEVTKESEICLFQYWEFKFCQRVSLIEFCTKITLVISTKGDSYYFICRITE